MNTWDGAEQRDVDEANEWREYVKSPIPIEEMKFLKNRGNFQIRFKLGMYRKDRWKKQQKPISRSRYANELFKIGAGWSE